MRLQIFKNGDIETADVAGRGRSGRIAAAAVVGENLLCVPTSIQRRWARARIRRSWGREEEQKHEQCGGAGSQPSCYHGTRTCSGKAILLRAVVSPRASTP